MLNPSDMRYDVQSVNQEKMRKRRNSAICLTECPEWSTYYYCNILYSYTFILSIVSFRGKCLIKNNNSWQVTLNGAYKHCIFIFLPSVDLIHLLVFLEVPYSHSQTLVPESSSVRLKSDLSAPVQCFTSVPIRRSIFTITSPHRPASLTFTLQLHHSIQQHLFIPYYYSILVVGPAMLNCRKQIYCRKIYMKYKGKNISQSSKSKVMLLFLMSRHNMKHSDF